MESASSIFSAVTYTMRVLVDQAFNQGGRLGRVSHSRYGFRHTYGGLLSRSSSAEALFSSGLQFANESIQMCYSMSSSVPDSDVGKRTFRAFRNAFFFVIRSAIDCGRRDIVIRMGGVHEPPKKELVIQ